MFFCASIHSLTNGHRAVDVPFSVEQLLEVEIGEGGGGVGPGAFEAGAIGVAAAQAMGATEGDDLLVREAHAVKNVAQVLRALSSIR